MSPLIETIRVDNGVLENAEYHFNRMGNAHRDALLKIELPRRGLHKLRIVYDESRFETSITPYTIRPVRSLKLVFDDNIVYDRKYEDRRDIERLFAMRTNCDDILIIKNEMVTDVSFANIIFLRGREWFTPDSFLLNGTMRQKLLDTGRIRERTIGVGDLRDFTHFKLINAMLRNDAPESEILNIR